jgi:hypothetical protein
MKKFLSLLLIGAMILSTTAFAQPWESDTYHRNRHETRPFCYNVVSYQYDAWGYPHRIVTRNCNYMHYPAYPNIVYSYPPREDNSTSNVIGGAILGLGLGALLFK